MASGEKTENNRKRHVLDTRSNFIRYIQKNGTHVLQSPDFSVRTNGLFAARQHVRTKRRWRDFGLSNSIFSMEWQEVPPNEAVASWVCPWPCMHSRCCAVGRKPGGRKLSSLDSRTARSHRARAVAANQRHGVWFLAWLGLAWLPKLFVLFVN